MVGDIVGERDGVELGWEVVGSEVVGSEVVGGALGEGVSGQLLHSM
jgi:hypothetical protein